jgi:hypothetical protein
MITYLTSWGVISQVTILPNIFFMLFCFSPFPFFIFLIRGEKVRFLQNLFINEMCKNERGKRGKRKGEMGRKGERKKEGWWERGGKGGKGALD